MPSQRKTYDLTSLERSLPSRASVPSLDSHSTFPSSSSLSSSGYQPNRSTGHDHYNDYSYPDVPRHHHSSTPFHSPYSSGPPSLASSTYGGSDGGSRSRGGRDRDNKTYSTYSTTAFSHPANPAPRNRDHRRRSRSRSRPRRHAAADDDDYDYAASSKPKLKAKARTQKVVIHQDEDEDEDEDEQDLDVVDDEYYPPPRKSDRGGSSRAEYDSRYYVGSRFSTGSGTNARADGGGKGGKSGKRR